MDGKPQADSQSSGFRSDAPLLRLEGPNLMADAASSLELTSSLPAMPEEQMVAAVSARESPASAPASANAPALSLQTDLEASHDHNVVLSFRSLGPIHIETTKEENEVPALSQEAQQHREGSNNSSEQEDGDGNPSSAEQHERNALVFWKACLTCLGIVYGDIGTSPIYTVSSCVSDLVNTRGEIAEADILGIISLLFWALVLVPTCKYCVWVLKATYHGEGGTFSLMGLLSQPKVREKYPKWMYNLLLPGSLCAISLLIGDAAITPAISVVSAIEGIGVYAPSITRDEIVGISIAILGLLYLGQKAGVTRIGACFGPFVLIWFVTLGSLGVYYISYAPGIFKAVSPHYAVDYFVRNGRQSYSILGLVVLSITGVEALYADLGQFGAPAVRWTWICLCLPCLLLQYFGQGAVILSNLSDTDSAQNIFFSAVPRSLLWPVFTITTIATIIASQATISGVQVVIMQAIHLNCFPRLHVIHQSKQYHSRIYIPLVNYLLMAATLSLTAAFRSSANLTLMYGLTISLIMLATTLATAMVMLYVWAWNRWLVAAWALCFTFVDSLFVGATIEKIATGGWLPVSFAFTAGALLLSYNYGFVEANKAEASVAELYLGNPLANRDNLPEDATISEQFKELCVALTSLIAIRDSKVAVLQRERPGEPKNLSVFLTSNLSRVPLSLVHLVNTLNIFPSRVLILNVQFVTKPFAQDNRLSFIAASSVGGPDWLYGAVIRVGFAETKQLDIARFVDQIVIPSIVLEETITQYFVTDREFDIDKNNHPIRKFALAAFTFLQLNATRISRFFHLPTDRTLEIGVRVPL